MAVRRIIKIDTDKCNGCGMCVSACAEGALAIIDGKARLLRDDYCDGLGACIGHCPQDAIAFEEREAADFDHQAVQQHIDKQMSVSRMNGHGCPSLQVRRLTAGAGANMPSWAEGCDMVQSRLANWPVQISLVPVNAGWLDSEKIIIAADCCGMACPDLHTRHLDGVSPLLIGCPKLDNAQAYCEKLQHILTLHPAIKKIAVLFMEVPCCSRMMRLVEEAAAGCGRGEIEIQPVVVKIG